MPSVVTVPGVLRSLVPVFFQVLTSSFNLYQALDGHFAVAAFLASRFSLGSLCSLQGSLRHVWCTSFHSCFSEFFKIIFVSDTLLPGLNRLFFWQFTAELLIAESRSVRCYAILCLR